MVDGTSCLEDTWSEDAGNFDSFVLEVELSVCA